MIGDSDADAGIGQPVARSALSGAQTFRQGLPAAGLS
jgi:hypothetical protein